MYVPVPFFLLFFSCLPVFVSCVAVCRVVCVCVLLFWYGICAGGCYWCRVVFVVVFVVAFVDVVVVLVLFVGVVLLNVVVGGGCPCCCFVSCGGCGGNGGGVFL